MKMRYRCPAGHAIDGNETTTLCSQCGAALQLNDCGAIQLYRMGNYMGCAVGMGIYIDDVPYGHIANKESIRIVVPYGPHKVHITHTTTRKCNDPVITVDAANPVAYIKAHFAAMGFKIVVESVDASSMPPM